MKTCFSIMPFNESFRDIDRIIRMSAESSGFKYVRGDLSKKPGKILSHIIHEIRQASVVVADVTGHNPNVFYELGIAHQLLGDDRVVIIRQKGADRDPFDVHQFRQLRYEHSASGRRRLRQELPPLLAEATRSTVDRENWDIIRGRLARTKMIVRDLHLLLETTTERAMKEVVIRVVAGLGSLAISDREPRDGNVDAEYEEALRQERDVLRTVLLRGARLKAVLNPPRRLARSLVPIRLCRRYERLIGLLSGRSDFTGETAAEDLEAIPRCEFVLSPVAMPNQFIIGTKIAYEGLKRGGSGGFDVTHWETDAGALRELIEQFDRFFEDSRRDMAHGSNVEVANQLAEYYREAVEAERRAKAAAS